MKKSDEVSIEDLFELAPQLSSPDAYPKRTDDCPSLAQFPRAVRFGWSASDRVHVSGCGSCQYRTAKQWLMDPPPLLVLAAYRAGESPDDQAMAIYLSWREGEVARRLLQKSVYVRALAEIFRGVKAVQEISADVRRDLTLAGLVLDLNRMSVVSGASRSINSVESGAIGVRGIQDLAGPAMAGQTSHEATAEAEAIRASTGDNSLMAEVGFRGSDELSIYATSPSIENSGRRVLIEMLPENGEPLQIELRLKEQPTRDRAEANQVVVVQDVGRFRRNTSLLVAWIS